MKEIRLSDFSGKIKVITVFSSLDTSLCNLPVKEFNAQPAKYFLSLIGLIVEEQGQYPLMMLTYSKLKITLIIYAIGRLTENDFIAAGIIDELGGA